MHDHHPVETLRSRPETTLTDFDPSEDRIRFETPGHVSLRLDRDAAVAELLGAINYLAGAVIYLEEHDNGQDDG
jgi:hypothetical protein